MPKKNSPPDSPSASLFMVATPIGNLEDLSPRAVRTLGEVDAILSEDTRRTRILLSHFKISGRLERLDQNASDSEIAGWVKFLSEGAEAKSIALVTDAGTPGVSDPGARLVQAARAAGAKIVPIPGPSAVTALVSVLGWNEPEFSFLGFFPRKPGERDRLFEQLRQTECGGMPLIWFESPHRIRESLEWIAEYSSKGPEISLVVAKELTKTFERIFVGQAAQIKDEVVRHLDEEGDRGEWCFALKFSKEATGAAYGRASPGAQLDPNAWKLALQCCLESGGKVSACTKSITRAYGVSRNDVYAAALLISENLEKKSSGGD